MNNIYTHSELLTPDEVSKILKVGYRTVLDMINTGLLEAIKIGRQYRIPQNSLNSYIKSSIIKPEFKL